MTSRSLTARALPVASGLLLLAACESGRLETPWDGGCTGPSCSDADLCDGGGCDDGHVEPCTDIVCGSGQRCVDGRCLVFDSCAGVVCGTPGEVCDPRDGTCRPGVADDDRDGVTIAEGDCDDGDPGIHPGATEECDGVDQDCDLEVDEGIAPRPCSTDCGDGDALCEGGVWACSVPEVCECTPAGETEAQACGVCGEQRRVCGADLMWNEWSECEDHGECAPSTTGSRSCGNCDLGTQTRSCSDTCEWDSWGACSWGGTTGTCLACTADVGDPADGPYLGSGWHGREDGLGRTSRWVDGSIRRAELTLGVATAVTTLRCTWMAYDWGEGCTHPGTYGGNVRVDGAVAGSISLPADGAFHSQTFSVPAGAAADGILEVQIEPSNGWQPSACSSSPDTRVLSIYVDLVSAC